MAFNRNVVAQDVWARWLAKLEWQTISKFCGGFACKLWVFSISVPFESTQPNSLHFGWHDVIFRRVYLSDLAKQTPLAWICSWKALLLHNVLVASLWLQQFMYLMLICVKRGWKWATHDINAIQKQWKTILLLCTKTVCCYFIAWSSYVRCNKQYTIGIECAHCTSVHIDRKIHKFDDFFGRKRC